jgi:hypothetical protein
MVDRNMPRFVAGVIVGLFLGACASAYAAGCFGFGNATGWTVVKDGEEVCSDPDINNTTKEIECD